MEKKSKRNGRAVSSHPRFIGVKSEWSRRDIEKEVREIEDDCLRSETMVLDCPSPPLAPSLSLSK